MSKHPSRLNRVTFYINPNDPDGQRLVLPGLQTDENLKVAADHFGCHENKIVTFGRMVPDEYLEQLSEYDG